MSVSESSYVELSQIITRKIQLDFRRSAGLRYRNKIQLAYIWYHFLFELFIFDRIKTV